ncbi:hypothetical protein EOD41_18005 [Mucilaginibacter limnophilus]|uniref:Uncharacterized protein n=1 Tax=Mucilaginibacter limnophilus TaxID=1932778 RepID=A0A3S2XYX7_9SPHI|nr:hypothetical protein [Mucilaginibacter limnophilus]RVT98264.1 hypothetical protein EOD41_18005 [Mucilaginibacter limnophilus]
MQNQTFIYSKKAVIVYLLYLSLVTLMLVIYLIESKNNGFWVSLNALLLIIIIIVFLNNLKFIKTGLKGEVALKINDTFIRDNTYKRFIYWKDINNIYLYDSGVISFHMKQNQKPQSVWDYPVYYYNKLFYGSNVVLNTALIKGKGTEIYNDIISGLNNRLSIDVS